MILLIDGYNVLKQIYSNIKGPITRQRTLFIKELGIYHKLKKEHIKEIIVVFDAGLFNHATREIKDGIIVVFSGQKKTADDWIIEFIERKQEYEITLVSMDRKLIASCHHPKLTIIDSIEFYHIMNQVLLHTKPTAPPPSSTPTPIKKYIHAEADDTISDIQQEELDLLMEQASTYIPHEKLNTPQPHQTKYTLKKQKLSKKEKNTYAVLKKLH